MMNALLSYEQQQKLEQAKMLYESVLQETAAIYPNDKSTTMSDPCIPALMLKALIGFEEREVFATIFLDNQNREIKTEKLFFGTINESSVYVREIIKMALLCNAAAIIISHNHPSGMIKPSNADHMITRKISEACCLMDIRLLDHIIVSRQDFYSFVESGDLS